MCYVAYTSEHVLIEKGQPDCKTVKSYKVIKSITKKLYKLSTLQTLQTELQLNRMQCRSAKASKLGCNANYWSSTEYNATNAYNFNFNNGNANNNNKTNTYSVRGVRDFSNKTIFRNSPFPKGG